MLKGIIAAGALASIGLAAPPVTAQAGPARIVDGDTIDVAGIRVRLWGIDAPEAGQICERGGAPYSCGEEASANLRAIVGSTGVACEWRTKDRYGRAVAVCRAGLMDIGAVMVRDGWALAFTRYSADYIGEERQAREAKLGLWGGSFAAPWDWRTAHRRPRMSGTTYFRAHIKGRC